MENRGLPDRLYLVSERHRLICCAIPKNGCTTIRKWFLAFADPAGLQSADVHRYCADHSALSLLPRPRREEAIASFFTLTFLRDPLVRLASAFIEKFVGGHSHGHFEPAREVLESVALDHGVGDATRGITFREFVQYLHEAPDDHLDYHWRPQSAILVRRRMDFTGRVSQLTEALTAISIARGYPRPPEAEALPRAASDGGFLGDTPSGELYRAFCYSRGVLPAAEALFDPEIRSSLLARYATDVELYRGATDRLPEIPPIEPPDGESIGTIPRPNHGLTPTTPGI